MKLSIDSEDLEQKRNTQLRTMKCGRIAIHSTRDH